MQVQEIDEIAIKIANLKEKKKELEKEVSSIEKDLDFNELRLSEILLEQGKTSWEVQGVGKFGIRISSNWSTEDRSKLIEYFKTNNPEMLTVNSNSLKAWANAEREANPGWDYKAIGLADPFEKKKITYTRSK